MSTNPYYAHAQRFAAEEAVPLVAVPLEDPFILAAVTIELSILFLGVVTVTLFGHRAAADRSVTTPVPPDGGIPGPEDDEVLLEELAETVRLAA